MKYLLSTFLICALLLGMTISLVGWYRAQALKEFIMHGQSESVMTVQAPEESAPISNEEKSALVAGLTMGLDLALALDNRPRLESAKFYSLMQGFALMVEPCKTIRCVTDRIVKLGNDIRAAQPPDTKRGMPEILR